MGERGFTLVELIIVMALIVTLSSMAVMGFTHYREKTGIEQETRTLYADLMDVRAQSIMQKDSREVIISTTQLSVQYTGGQAIYQGKPFRYPITYSSPWAKFKFDTSGVASPSDPNYTDLPLFICVQPVGGTSAAVDAIKIDQTMIQMGKVTDGGTCTSGNITLQ